MPMWPCNFEACKRPAVRTLGECILCDRHLCSVHLQREYHHCPTWEDADAFDLRAHEAEERELTTLIQKIDTSALASGATHLRHGVLCSIPTLQYDRETRRSVMGGMNYHIILRDYIVRSEVATLQFLEKTKVPAPRVFDYAFEDADNPVGVGYILMENLPGTSLSWSSDANFPRRKIMDQLADICIEIQKYLFKQLGSLDHPCELHVGPFSRESLTDFDESGVRPIGPLSSLEEYHKASIRLILDLIVRNEIYSQRAVDAYLVHRFLLDLVPWILPPSAHGETDFYLKHADDKGDHTLVDDDFNVTGIIDWEWAHTASAAHAFNSPIALLPVSSFYNGVNDLGDDEVASAEIFEDKCREDLAALIRSGRLQHRFAFCCGHDLEDWEGFLGLFQGLRDGVGVDGGLDWGEWKARSLVRYRNDVGLQALLARSTDTCRPGGKGRRPLTDMLVIGSNSSTSSPITSPEPPVTG